VDKGKSLAVEEGQCSQSIPEKDENHCASRGWSKEDIHSPTVVPATPCGSRSFESQKIEDVNSTSDHAGSHAVQGNCEIIEFSVPKKPDQSLTLIGAVLSLPSRELHIRLADQIALIHSKDCESRANSFFPLTPASSKEGPKVICSDLCQSIEDEGVVPAAKARSLDQYSNVRKARHASSPRKSKKKKRELRKLDFNMSYGKPKNSGRNMDIR